MACPACPFVAIVCLVRLAQQTNKQVSLCAFVRISFICIMTAVQLMQKLIKIFPRVYMCVCLQ